MPHVKLIMPDLELPGVAAVACAWHGQVGVRVVEGDALLEILAGEVMIELPAPSTGVLLERCVETDQRVTPGQVLAIIETPDG